MKYQIQRPWRQNYPHLHKKSRKRVSRQLGGAHEQQLMSDVCRVCRVEGDEEMPLIYPCKCSGSVRYVHPDWSVILSSRWHKLICTVSKAGWQRVRRSIVRYVDTNTTLPKVSTRTLVSLTRSISRLYTPHHTCHSVHTPSVQMDD